MNARLANFENSPLVGAGNLKYKYAVQLRDNSVSPWYNEFVTNDYDEAASYLQKVFEDIKKSEDDAIVPLLESNLNIIDAETDTTEAIQRYFKDQRAIQDSYKLLGIFCGDGEVLALSKNRIYSEYSNGQYNLAHWNYGSEYPGRVEDALTAAKVFEKLGISYEQLESEKAEDEEIEEEQEEQEQIEENEQESGILRHRSL